MVEEEVDGGQWRNLDDEWQGSSSGTTTGVMESSSIPSFPRPSDQVFAGTSSSSSASVGSRHHPEIVSTGSHRTRPSFSSSGGRGEEEKRGSLASMLESTASSFGIPFGEVGR